MMKCLQVRIKDSSLLLLIRRFLKAGYIDADEFVLTTKGTPQGCNLIPQTILAKIRVVSSFSKIFYTKSALRSYYCVETGNSQVLRRIGAL